MVVAIRRTIKDPLFGLIMRSLMSHPKSIAIIFRSDVAIVEIRRPRRAKRIVHNSWSSMWAGILAVSGILNRIDHRLIPRSIVRGTGGLRLINPDCPV